MCYVKMFLDIVFYTLDELLSCHPPKSPVNGEVLIIGITATYTCDSGFMLNGNETQECQKDGIWSGAAPTCQNKGM